MSISYSFKLNSHKYNSGLIKLLYNHLKSVGETSREIILTKEIKNKDLYANLSYLVGISHDFAKATSYFQKYLETNTKTKKAYHGKLSSIFGYFLTREYIKLKNISLEIFNPVVSWLVIMKHHGDIDDLLGTEGELKKLDKLNIEREQIEDIRNLYINEVSTIYEILSPIRIDMNCFFENFEEICEEIKKEGEKFSFQSTLKNYFLILLFYSTLLDSDKLDAARLSFEGLIIEKNKWKDIPDDLVDNYKKIKFKNNKGKIDILRDKAYRNVILSLKEIEKNLNKNRIFSIELPTGYGKTLISFSFALKLRKIICKRMGFTPKIIYSLPFLSIIDQNSLVFSEVLIKYLDSENFEKLLNLEFEDKIKKLEEIPTSLLLKHHHLSDVRYKTHNDELDVDIAKSLILVEGWHSEIIITTFVQFFHSLITNKNKAARKFHNIINSIIILDEVQSIPYEYWKLVKEILNYITSEYNCWLILMTATQPYIFGSDEIKSLILYKKEFFTKFDRVSYQLKLEEIELDRFKELLLGEILKKKINTAIVVNTVKASKELYKFLRESFIKEYGNPNISKEGIAEFKNIILVNLSTHIIPLHRIERLRKINTSADKIKIIITTQLIEAGVDIDVDLIYRDLAPFDCIIQTGGRCNRNNKNEKGECKIIQLVKKNKKKFCNIYDSTLISLTREILESVSSGTFGEIDNISLTKQYFKKILERGSIETSNYNLDAILNLKFSEVGNFKLIKDEYIKEDVFVNIDYNSNKIWEKYESIIKVDDFIERRNKFLEIKNIFYNYVISIDARKVNKDNIKLQIGFLNKEEYDLETGYKESNNNVLIY